MLKRIEVQNPVLLNRVHYLTSDYKTRNEDRSTHNGMDFVGKSYRTDYVIAIDDGVVITSTYSKTAGYYIEIKHNNNYISRYLHMTKGSLKFKKNARVKKGDTLGYMGNTGNSTGAHLHFAVTDEYRNPVDPLPYLQGKLSFSSINDSHTTFVANIQSILKTDVTGISNNDTLAKTITVSAKINRKHKVVKPIQTYLYSLGYKEVGASDGIAGPKFTKAVKNYQRDNNCVVDGEITKRNKTWRKLLKL